MLERERERLEEREEEEKRSEAKHGRNGPLQFNRWTPIIECEKKKEEKAKEQK